MARLSTKPVLEAAEEYGMPGNYLNGANIAGLLKSGKFQAPKYKSQININDRNSKFKTDRMKARHPRRD